MDEKGVAGAVPAETSLVRAEYPVEEVRVSGRTNCSDLAWAICKTHEKQRRVCLIGIGTQAVSQAVKAIAIANSRSASHGIVFTALPAMVDVQIADENSGQSVERTVMKLTLVPYGF